MLLFQQNIFSQSTQGFTEADVSFSVPGKLLKISKGMLLALSPFPFLNVNKNLLFNQNQNVQNRYTEGSVLA